MIYQLCVSVDVDGSLDPPWITMRLVEAGAHRGGITQAKHDLVPPYHLSEICEMVGKLEERLVAHISAIDGVQLEL